MSDEKPKRKNYFPEGKRFQKGQSGNPGGRPKLPPELKAIKELTVEEVKRIFAKYARMSIPEIEKCALSQDLPIFELVVASGLRRAFTYGDYKRLNFILDRTIGRIVDKTEVNLPAPLIIRSNNHGEIELTSRLEEIE